MAGLPWGGGPRTGPGAATNGAESNIVRRELTQLRRDSMMVDVVPYISDQVTLSPKQTGLLFTNENAYLYSYFYLPKASPGLKYSFYVQTADLKSYVIGGVTITNYQAIGLVAKDLDTISVYGKTTDKTDPYGTVGPWNWIYSQAKGSAITITAINTTQWVATSVVGSWNVV